MFRFGVVFGMLLLLVCGPLSAQPQPTAADVEQAIRLAEELWKVLEIEKQTTPQEQARVLLQAPNEARERVMLYGEEALKLVQGDVIKFKHTAAFITIHPRPWDGRLEFDRPAEGKELWQKQSKK